MQRSDEGQLGKKKAGLDVVIVDYGEALRPGAGAGHAGQDAVCTAVCEGQDCTAGDADSGSPAYLA